MWLKRTFKLFLFLILFSLILISLLIGSVYIGVFGPLPEKSDLASISNEEASLVLSNDGTLIGKFFAENRTNIKWDDVPQNLVNALVATEDKRFFEHQGIDGRSYLRVFFKSILMGNKSAGGGSTLTQQLVKNLYGRNDHSFLSLPVSKTREAIIAYRMEEVLSKKQILLLYLNSVPFGEEVFGIEAAAKRYFDKNAKDLHIEESAVLVGILKANTYYNPRIHPENAIKRRNQVIALMANQGFITETEADRIQQLKLSLEYTNYQLESPAGYFVYQVKKRAAEILESVKNKNGIPYNIRKDGLKIHTTLDIQLQQLANKASLNQLSQMQPLLNRELKRFGQRKKWEAELAKNNTIPENWKTNQNREILSMEGMKTENISRLDSLWHYYKMLNAAVLAVNPTTGAIKAWTGGNNFRYLPLDLTLSQRQIASTIKPIIYAAALEEGFTSCDYFNNTVQEYEDYESWKPENYDKSSSELLKVAMWYALTRSMNLPTVDIYFQTGHEEIADLCRRLDLETPFDETPAMALGALDASLYELVKAYSAFANDGMVPDDLIMIEKITDGDGNVIYQRESFGATMAMGTAVSRQITSILERAIDEGTGMKIRNTYGIQSDLAGKTGTAQNYSDAWFIAYTPDLVIGSWVGARSPQMHFRSGLGSGSSLALPITGNILSAVEKNPSMKAKYLTPFAPLEDTVGFMNCEPFRAKDFDETLNKNKNAEEDKTSVSKKREKREERQSKNKPEKKRSKVRKFFDKLFKKKDKKKKN